MDQENRCQAAWAESTRKALQWREELCVRAWITDFKFDVDENSCESRICAAMSSWGHNLRETQSPDFFFFLLSLVNKSTKVSITDQVKQNNLNEK